MYISFICSSWQCTESEHLTRKPVEEQGLIKYAHLPGAIESCFALMDHSLKHPVSCKSAMLMMCMCVQATKALQEERPLQPGQLEALKRLQDIQTVCEARLLRLQPLLSLFHDF